MSKRSITKEIIIYQNTCIDITLLEAAAEPELWSVLLYAEPAVYDKKIKKETCKKNRSKSQQQKKNILVLIYAQKRYIFILSRT